MTDSTENELVSSVAHDVVILIAPQELPIFQTVCEAYFDDPRKALMVLKSEDTVLGFGPDASAALLMPIVLAVVSEVFQLLVQIGKKGIEDAFGGEVTAIIKGMLRKGDHPKRSSLTKEQIRLVHQKALAAAKGLRLSDDKAAALANSIIAQLRTVTE